MSVRWNGKRYDDTEELLDKLGSLVAEGQNNSESMHQELMGAFNRIADAIEANTAEIRQMREELGPKKLNKGAEPKL